MNINLYFFLIITFSFFACREKKDINQMKEYDGPMLEVRNVETLFSDSAIVRVKLQAPIQIEQIDGDRDFPKGLYLEFYEIDGRLSATLKANKAHYFKKEDLWKGIGDVVVKSAIKQEQLNTEVLFWKPAEERVFTDKFVRIETEGDILMGEGLTARQDFTSYKILKPTGEMNIKDEGI